MAAGLRIFSGLISMSCSLIPTAPHLFTLVPVISKKLGVGLAKAIISMCRFPKTPEISPSKRHFERYSLLLQIILNRIWF